MDAAANTAVAERRTARWVVAPAGAGGSARSGDRVGRRRVERRRPTGLHADQLGAEGEPGVTRDGALGEDGQRPVEDGVLSRHQQPSGEPVHELDEQGGVVGPNGLPDRRERVRVARPARVPSGPVGRPGCPWLSVREVGRHERVDPEPLGRRAFDEPGVAGQPVQHVACVARGR